MYSRSLIYKYSFCYANNKWEEWSTNPLKQKAIEYYGMQERIKMND